MPDQIKIPWSKPAITNEEEEAMLSVIKSGWYTQGKKTREFETNLSEYLSSNVVVVNNGSSAITCALLAHGLKPGDKVLVPDFTFFATLSVPKMLGASVLVGDIDKSTLNMTPETVEKIVKENNIKFVIPVDVGGLSIDIDAYLELSKRYNFILIEDAAEAIGSEYKNKKNGSFEHTSIFSFHMAKTITTIEGGCISTKDEKLLKKILQIRDQGRTASGQYVHDIIGSNFRTTDLQSAMGIRQLEKIENFINKRNSIAEQYKNRIHGLQFQHIPNYANIHSYMMFFALSEDKENRDRRLLSLRENGIDARTGWLPLHLQPSNPELSKSNCPNAKEIYDNSFTLPIYNSMTKEETKYVIEKCNLY